MAEPTKDARKGPREFVKNLKLFSNAVGTGIKQKMENKLR